MQSVSALKHCMQLPEGHFQIFPSKNWIMTRRNERDWLPDIIFMDYRHDRLAPPGIFEFVTTVFRRIVVRSFENLRFHVLGPPAIAYKSPEEIIYSNNVRSNSEPLPDGFLVQFLHLSLIPFGIIINHLDMQSAHNLRLTGRLFHDFIEDNEKAFPIRFIEQGEIFLQDNGNIQVVRGRRSINLDHYQLGASLRKVRFRIFSIAHFGPLRAEQFHISDLTCTKIEIRLSTPVQEDQVAELLDLFRQVVLRPSIGSVVLFAKVHGNRSAVKASLEAIARGAVYLDPNRTHIVVLPPH